jgi:hypothetical protein
LSVVTIRTAIGGGTSDRLEGQTVSKDLAGAGP